MLLVTPDPRDLDALMTMMEAFNRFESIVWTRATGEAPLRQLLGDPSLGFVVLARETAEGADLGYAVVTYGFDLEWAGRDAFLTELWLEPAARGQGVGARLLAAVEAKARATGVRAMHLMVRHANANAQALYRRAGYGVPDRLFMTRRL